MGGDRPRHPKKNRPRANRSFDKPCSTIKAWDLTARATSIQMQLIKRSVPTDSFRHCR